MIKVFINNKPILVPKNTSVLEACDSIGISVPRFCYHERLNVAGNCRMCLVEIEKAPKPIAACAFPVAPNMQIYTDTPLVHKARENVLEFLLINHPLDCPICDQGGECDLQEQTLVFGSERSRFFSTKRGVEDKNCGFLVKTIMTRCIHCTRCVRFFQDVAGEEDFGTTLRGQDTEIGTYVGKMLNSELSGNIIDLCPVGALTSKPYSFTARPWEIKSVETIDLNDSIGSNIKINFKETEILRILPVLNDSLNEEWISDKTRFSFDGLKIQRIGSPFFKSSSIFEKKFLKNLLFTSSPAKKNLQKATWRIVLNYFSFALSKTSPNNVLFICGNLLDLEILYILKKISQLLNISLISENFLNSNNNLMASGKLNTIFSDILKADLCLTIGTNLRFEASLLNVRLKKRIQKGNFVKASIGLTENLTYKNFSIGNSLKTLLDIAEGKHSFCQKLVKAKNPFLILGSGIKKRLDGPSALFLIKRLSNYTNICYDNWFGSSFLPLTPNGVSKHFVGIETNNKLNLSKKKFIYCVGLDSYKILKSTTFQNAPFIVAQSPFFNAFLKEADLILPSTAFTEKKGTFLNLEGRDQETSTVFVGPSLSRDDFKIVDALFSNKLKDSNHLYGKSSKNLIDFNQNNITFIKSLYFLNNKKFIKIYKTPLKLVLSNFFISNAITSNSLIMSKCASAFKKNYVNFI